MSADPTPADGLPVLADPHDIAANLIRLHYGEGVGRHVRIAVADALGGPDHPQFGGFVTRVRTLISRAQVRASWPSAMPEVEASEVMSPGEEAELIDVIENSTAEDFVEVTRPGTRGVPADAIVLEPPTVHEIPLPGGERLKVLVGADVELEYTDADGFETGLYLSPEMPRQLAARLALAADEVDADEAAEAAP